MSDRASVGNRKDVAWCPGCGNFGLKTIMAKVLQGLDIPREDLVFVSGIGQAAKAPQYYEANHFNGLHGRALPAAAGIKAANPGLKLIVESGDGDMYGEGGNHFLHAIRRNPDITVVVHDNMVYGLTKGQAAPTSRPGMKTPIQVEGVFEFPLNPVALAISLDCSFVARGSTAEPELTAELIRMAVAHRGFALIDVFQACVTFNKVNTHQWYKENTYVLGKDFDPRDRAASFAKALEEEPFPLGLLYLNPDKPLFEERLAPYSGGDRSPLFARARPLALVDELLAERV